MLSLPNDEGEQCACCPPSGGGAILHTFKRGSGGYLPGPCGLSLKSARQRSEFCNSQTKNFLNLVICSEANPWPLGSLVALVLSVYYVGDIARAPALALSLALALALGLGLGLALALALALAFALALVLTLALALGLRPRPWPCRYPFPLLNCHAQEALTFLLSPTAW